MNNIVVVGIGNILKTDEGIGVRILQELSKCADEFPSIDFVDLGSGGMGLLHVIAHRAKAVMIDCAFMGKSPGTMSRFTPEQVTTQKLTAGLSLHEGDVLSIIALSRRLGEAPGKIVIFGVEPYSIDPGEDLSTELEKRLGTYVSQIKEELLMK
ncbi:MAG: hydrogenase maturation protease [Chitinivibrionales bacterium]